MDYQAKFGPYALVAGASTTVGEQFARQLAAKGMNVVLVARRLPLLEKIAGEIREAYGVDARPVAMDLTADDAVDELAAAVADLEIGILVEVEQQAVDFAFAGTNELFAVEEVLGEMDPGCIPGVVTALEDDERDLSFLQERLVCL